MMKCLRQQQLPRSPVCLPAHHNQLQLRPPLKAVTTNTSAEGHIATTHSTAYASKQQETAEKPGADSRVTSKAEEEKKKPESQSTGFLQSAPTGSKHPVFRPRVGDWKCAHCERSQRPYHQTCRSHYPKYKDESYDDDHDMSGEY
jgi:hypothetical protein